MRIEFEPLDGGRHSVVAVDTGRRWRTDVVVSGDIKDRTRPLWFYGPALAGVMLRERLVAFLKKEFKSVGH